MKATISIVVPTYNRVGLLERSINSVLAGMKADLEVAKRTSLIISDDGSTLPAAKKLLRHYASDRKHPDVMVLQAEKNSGSASGPRNRALDVVDSDYVFFLDSDDYLGHEALPRLLHLLDEHQPDYIFPNQIIEGNRTDGSGLFDKTYIEEDLLFALRSLIATRVFRMDIIRSLGLRFDEYLKIGEDVLFTLSFMVNAQTFGFAGDYGYYYKTEHASRSEDQHQSRKGVSHGISFYERALFHAHTLQRGLVAIAVAPLSDEQRKQAAFQVLIPRTIKEVGRFLREIENPDRQRGAFFAISHALRSPLVTAEGPERMRPEARHFFSCALRDDLDGFLGDAPS